MVNEQHCTPEKLFAEKPEDLIAGDCVVILCS